MSLEVMINDAVVSNVTLCVSYFGNGVNFSDVAVSVDIEVTGGKYEIMTYYFTSNHGEIFPPALNVSMVSILMLAEDVVNLQ